VDFSLAGEFVQISLESGKWHRRLSSATWRFRFTNQPVATLHPADFAISGAGGRMEKGVATVVFGA
jgi:hypothetical protein